MPRTQKNTYDITLKDIVTLRPRDALVLAKITDALDVQIEDTDLSSLLAVADKVLRVLVVEGEFLVHFEFQSGHDVDLVPRIFWYNAALHRRHRLAVNTVLILLTKKADGAKITGAYDVVALSGKKSITFRYDVIRLWQVPVETILSGPVGLLPLAPLCQGAEEIEPIITRMDRRIESEATRQEEGKLWLATYALLGFRFDAKTALELLPKGKAMKESTTYQAIIEEGRQEGLQKGIQEGRQEGEHAEAKKVLLRLGRKHLGAPSAGIRHRLDAIDGVEAIESLIDRVHEAAGWDELLPAPSPSSTRKKKA